MRFKLAVLCTASLMALPALVVVAQEGERAPRRRPQVEQRERQARPERPERPARPEMGERQRPQLDRAEMLNRMKQRHAAAVESGDTERADNIAARIRRMEERPADRERAPEPQQRQRRPENQLDERPRLDEILQRMQARHDEAVQAGDDDRAAAIAARMERVRQRAAAREGGREREVPQIAPAPQRPDRGGRRPAR